MEVSELNTEQRAFFDHYTLSGTTHELILRRNELRDSLVKNTVLGANRKPATLAMAELQRQIQPAETPAEKQEKVDTNFIRMAQKFADQGNVHQAAELLKTVNLEMDALVDSPDFGVRRRISEAKEEYARRRAESIQNVMTQRGINRKKATEFFTGAPDLTGVPKQSRQFMKPSPHSMNALLQAEVNRAYFFDPLRPFE